MLRPGTVLRTGIRTRGFTVDFDGAPAFRGNLGKGIWSGTDTFEQPIVVKVVPNGRGADWERENLSRLPKDDARVANARAVVRGSAQTCFVFNDVGRPMSDAFRAAMRDNPAGVMTFGAKVLEALKVSHAAGLIHSDLKPENILLGDDDPSQVTLIDFGHATQMADDGSGRLWAFSHPHTSPEMRLFGGKYVEVTRASDTFVVAQLMAELLTGRSIFPPDKTALPELEQAYANGPDLSDVSDPALRAVLEKALSPEAADRFPDAPSFLVALEKVRRCEQNAG